jgi:iron(II)-dependent oxidoreductase
MIRWIVFAICVIGGSIILIPAFDPTFLPSQPPETQRILFLLAVASIALGLWLSVNPPKPQLNRTRVSLLVILILVVLMIPIILPNLTRKTVPMVASNEEWLSIRDNYEWERQFNGVEMVLVPPGCFTMGSVGTQADEDPVDEQCFDKPIWIDKYEVTVEQYDNAKGNLLPKVLVTWDDAKRHCEKRKARLPTEPEWEYAARGPREWQYPWGEEFRDSLVIGIPMDTANTAPERLGTVTSKPGGASWVGAMHMSGNAAEWVSTIYDQVLFPYPYPKDSDDGRENPQYTSGRLRVLRGGSWRNNWIGLRGADRSYAGQIGRDYLIGFRCARDYDG